MLRLVVLAALAAGCYEPSFDDCELRCAGAAEACPSGYHCVSGLCRPAGATAACGATDGGPGDDAAPDANPAEWSEPVMVLGVPGSWNDPTLSEDEREMFVVDDNGTIFRTTYTDATSTWDLPARVAELDGEAGTFEYSPYLTRSGHRIYFTSNRHMGQSDIYTATRPGGVLFDIASVARVNDLSDLQATDSGGATTTDEALIVIVSDRDGGIDLYESTHSGGAWSFPELLDTLNSDMSDTHPTLTGDGLTIVFTSNRDGEYDLYIATRASRGVPFETPEKIERLGTPQALEVDPWISSDGSTLYFASGAGSFRAIYRSERM